MRRITERILSLLALTTAFLLTVSGTGHAQTGVTTINGTLPNGKATYLIEVPVNWNGTLFLYSHGYVPPGSPNPARDVAQGDLATRFFMLSSGFALAGSSYATTGWALRQNEPSRGDIPWEGWLPLRSSRRTPTASMRHCQCAASFRVEWQRGTPRSTRSLLSRRYSRQEPGWKLLTSLTR